VDDDPGFLDRLSELDEGLDPGPRAVLPSPVSAAPASAPLTIDAAFEGFIDPATVTSPLPPLESSSRRRLLDLFPPEPAENAGSPRLARGPAGAPLTPRRLKVARGVLRTPDAPTYETFYGLREAPFGLSPDPRFLYHSAPLDRVAQQLLTAIRGHEGLVVLTGDVGTGKTTLCRAIVEQLDRRTLTSLITDPSVSGEDLLKNVLADFGVLSRDELASGVLATRHDLSATLQSFIESLGPLQARAVIIIDEAQNLPSDVLEEVRVLSDPGNGARLLQLVLVGQPGLTPLLRRSEYKAIDQRVTLRCSLEPLPADEIAGYVIHRLGVAGSSAGVEFDGAAMTRIFALSRGLPRVVNLICDRALARGFEASAGTIDVHLVDAAADDLDLGLPESRLRAVGASLLAAVGLLFCLLTGAGAAAWLFRDEVSRTIAHWGHLR
jgi:general secretion pathway protein A